MFPIPIWATSIDVSQKHWCFWDAPETEQCSLWKCRDSLKRECICHTVHWAALMLYVIMMGVINILVNSEHVNVIVWPPAWSPVIWSACRNASSSGWHSPLSWQWLFPAPWCTSSWSHRTPPGSSDHLLVLHTDTNMVTQYCEPSSTNTLQAGIKTQTNIERPMGLTQRTVTLVLVPVREIWQYYKSTVVTTTQ